MIAALFAILLAVCLSQAFRIIKKTETFLHFNGIVVFSYFIFVLPQLFALVYSQSNGYELLSDFAVMRVLIMSILCLWMAIKGFDKKPKQRELDLRIFIIDSSVARAAFVVYGLVGFYFYYKVNLVLEDMETLNLVLTGPASIYYSLSQLFLVGSIGLIFMALRAKSLINYILAAPCLLVMAYIGIVMSRRAMTFLLLISILSGLFFVKKIKPNRYVIIAFTVFSLLMVVSTGEYRSRLEKSDHSKGFSGAISTLTEIDLVGNFKRYLDNASVLEMRNAAYFMDSVARTNDYGLGRMGWNAFVHRYIPAQILGNDFKESLKFPMKFTEDTMNYYGYSMAHGSTITGIGDIFLEFGYFGCIFFYLIGRALRFCWEMAQRKEVLFFQILYILCLKEAALVVTHGVTAALPSFVYFVAILAPIIWLSKRRSRRSFVAA